MLVKLENGRDEIHVNRERILMAWESENRYGENHYSVCFTKDHVIHVDRKSFQAVVKWLDRDNDYKVNLDVAPFDKKNPYGVRTELL